MLSLIRKNQSFLDNFFDDFPTLTSSIPTSGLMKTDILETDSSYLLSIELAGYDKDDIKVSLTNKYLTVEIEKTIAKDKKTEGTFIRQERYYGAMKRRYYVGNVELEEIKGRFENGVLSLEIPKETNRKTETKYLELD